MNSNPTANSTASTPASADAISRRAYEIWESEGRPEGCDLRHWLQAEQELGVSRTREDQGNGAATAASASHPSNSNGAARTGNTDRPLANKPAGAARENKQRSTTAPFERAPSSGGAPAGAKRR